MTVSKQAPQKSVLDEVIAKKQAEEKQRKLELLKKRLIRSILSFGIPFSAALILSAIGTFGFHANGNASYRANLLFFFCKSFFPCLPFMVFFIVRD